MIEERKVRKRRGDDKGVAERERERERAKAIEGVAQH